MNILDILPFDCMCEIFRWIDPNDLESFILTSKIFYQFFINNEEKLCEMMYMNYFKKLTE